MAIWRDYSIQKAVTPAAVATSITNTNTTHKECRAIYVGVGDAYDFYVDGSWVLFKNAADGAIYPLRAMGARHNSGSSAPDAGDILFLY